MHHIERIANAGSSERWWLHTLNNNKLVHKPLSSNIFGKFQERTRLEKNPDLTLESGLFL